MKHDLLLTCNPGLEEVGIEELVELGYKAAKLDKGLLEIKNAGDEDVMLLNYASKTIHRIMIEVVSCEFSTLDDIYQKCLDVDYSLYVLPNQTFGVVSKRSGKHDFTSIDVSKVVGQAIIDSYLKEKGTRLKVYLKDPDVRFMARVHNNLFWLGIDTTGDSLHKRWYRKLVHITSLKSTIAHSMVRLSNLKNGESETFHDPMCGTGMIPIEAYHYLAKVPNKNRSFRFERLWWFSKEKLEEIKESWKEERVNAFIAASDWNREVVRKARINSMEANAKIRFYLGDATKIPLSSRIICVDLPYGVRMRKVNIPKLYAKFMRNVESSRCERVVMITASRNLKFLKKPKGFVIKKKLWVNYDDLDATIVVMDRVN